MRFDEVSADGRAGGRAEAASIAEVSRRRLALLLAWGLLLALGGSIYLGPYFAAWSIRRAVAAGDAEALHDFVDFEAVRENLKGELRRTVGARQRQAAASPPEPAADDGSPEPAPEPAPAEAPLTDLGARLAVTVGETMIDRFATPEGVDRALRSGAAEGGGDGWSSFLDLGGDGGSEGGGDRDSDRGGIEVRAGYDGWNDFAVRLGVEAEAADEAPIWADILFERRGIWAWRVTGARVSPDAISLLVR